VNLMVNLLLGATAKASQAKRPAMHLALRSRPATI
jgi:hypothetical protein